MKKLITILMCLACFNTFASVRNDSAIFGSLPTDSDFLDKAKIDNLEEILNQAEIESTVNGKKILVTGRSMIENQEVITGSCWDYIDGVFDRSGFPSNKRVTVFKSKLQGPYVDISRIESGDWLYFINHSYGDVEHSSIFIAWTNIEKMEALMISYAGGNQALPARYKIYDLSSVYNIIRGR